MRAILIDPNEQSVTRMEFAGEFKDLAPLLDCQWVQGVRLDTTRELIYVDEEGLIHEGEKAFFHIAGYHGPLCGKGLLIGPEPQSNDDDGPMFTPSRMEPQAVRDMVTWLTPEEAHNLIRANQAAFVRAAEAAGFQVERLDDFSVIATR